MIVLTLWRNIYCSVMSFLNNHQLAYYLHQCGANGPPSSMPCTLLCLVSDLSSPFPYSSVIFNCLIPGCSLQRVRRCLGRSVREQTGVSYRDLGHGDGDVLGLHGELHALLQVGGEALGLVRALAPVLAGAAAGGKHHGEQENPLGSCKALGWQTDIWHRNHAQVGTLDDQGPYHSSALP